MTLQIDDAFIAEWEPKYDTVANDENQYHKILAAVLSDMHAEGRLSSATFLAIWRWKGAMRVIHRVRLGEYESRYAPAFRRAASEPPELKLHALLGEGRKLPGLGAPMASAILHFMHPDCIPIIDVRTVGVLFEARAPDGRSLIATRQCDLRHYEEFRQAILAIQNGSPGRCLRQIDRALFAYHSLVTSPLTCNSARLDSRWRLRR